MIELEFIGGAGTVTGSKYLLRTEHATVLLDCGLFQGRRKESFERNRSIPVDPAALDAVVLSHAHLDHSGALPILWQRGYRGPIYATPATRDLCVPMLEDSAAIQVADARHIDKLIERGVEIEAVTPLYSSEDAIGAIELMVGLPYHRTQVIASGVTLTFVDAGHVLGSAIVVLDLDDAGARTRLVFTGDLGRRDLPILRDPEVVSGAHCLMIESTYGDRLHPPLGDAIGTLASTIQRTIGRGGKVIIPAFALERAQELVHALHQLRLSGRIPPVPVYVDSPLAIKVTDVFRLHPECLRRELHASLRGSSSPFDFPGLTYCRTSRIRRRWMRPLHPRSSSPVAGCAKAGACCITCARRSRTRGARSSSSGSRQSTRSAGGSSSYAVTSRSSACSGRATPTW